MSDCFFSELKENANEHEMENFIQELEIMKNVGKHENIVTLLGISQEKSGNLLFSSSKLMCVYKV